MIRFENLQSQARFARSSMPLIPLPDFALIRFSGADACDFLQGQLTCDVRALQPGRSSYGGYCTPKGRLLASFLLLSEGGSYAMILPAVLAETMRKRLTMYVLRAKVVISAPPSALLGALGNDLPAALAPLGLTPPPAPHQSVVVGERCAVRLPGERVLVITQGPDNIPDLAGDDDSWRSRDIRAGIPFILPATQEQFVPQMVNLDLIGGLSYSKGCYPGQEIVARTHYLGRLKQRMYRVTAASVLVAGDKLYCAELGDQSAGMIVNAAASGTGSYQALAVLQTANAVTATYHAGSLQGPALALEPLPYTVS
jgi:folate-binding protein YgfZ